MSLFMPKRKTWIIKLGGSLIGSDALHAWLDLIRSVSAAHRVVVVTGGGPFAEAVRETQSALRIDDPCAHAMAVQAMRQFALAAASLLGEPHLICADRLAEERFEADCAVWDPMDPAFEAGELPRDWRATSDSIAVWLGHRLGAAGAVLVKSRAPRHRAGNAVELAGEDFIDGYLPELLNVTTMPVWWFEGSDCSSFSRLLEGESMPRHLIIGGPEGPP